MKKLISSICLIIMTSWMLSAQGGKEQIKDRIKAKRVAFITDKLELSSQEAQVFWPLYNGFKEKERALREDLRPSKKIAEMTDQEVEQLLEDRLDNEEELLAAKREFLKEAKQVLPIKKLAKLYRAERRFKEMVLQRSRERHRRN